eukprot:Lankesteria_metandrocarpae@DN5024_c0_g1_i1.p1
MSSRGLVKPKYSAEVRGILGLTEVLRCLNGPDGKCPICKEECDLALGSNKSIDVPWVKGTAVDRTAVDRTAVDHTAVDREECVIPQIAGDNANVLVREATTTIHFTPEQIENAKTECCNNISTTEEELSVVADQFPKTIRTEQHSAFGRTSEPVMSYMPSDLSATVVAGELSPTVTQPNSSPAQEMCTVPESMQVVDSVRICDGIGDFSQDVPHDVDGDHSSHSVTAIPNPCGHNVVVECVRHCDVPDEAELDCVVHFLRSCMSLLSPCRHDESAVAIQTLSTPSNLIPNVQPTTAKSDMTCEDVDLISDAIKMFIAKYEFWSTDFLQNLVYSPNRHLSKNAQHKKESDNRVEYVVNRTTDNASLLQSSAIDARPTTATTTAQLVNYHSRTQLHTDTGVANTPQHISPQTTPGKSKRRNPRGRLPVQLPVQQSARPNVATYRDALLNTPMVTDDNVKGEVPKDQKCAQSGSVPNTNYHFPNNKTGIDREADTKTCASPREPTNVVETDGGTTANGKRRNVTGNGTGKSKRVSSKRKVVLTIGNSAKPEIVQSKKQMVMEKQRIASDGAAGKPTAIVFTSLEVKGYCARLNLIDNDLNMSVLQLLERLATFQKKVASVHGGNAKRLRFVCGFKESEKLIHNALDFLPSQPDADPESRRLMIRLMCPLKCVIIPPNLQVVSLGSLEKRIDDLTNNCGKLDIPLICALSRNTLGRACGKAVRQSAVGVVNVEGAFTEFKNMIKVVRRPPSIAPDKQKE